MSAKVDWTAQWSSHSPGFKEGKAHIKLPNEQIMELSPGPGFGDFSHPTTQLMVQLMAPHVLQRPVFDIGCGSGILSVAAKKMGALSVHICDIDPDAIIHAQENALLNGTTFSPDPPSASHPVILMNMIHSEQKTAWRKNHLPFHRLITSGILNTQEDEYMEFAKNNGWKRINQQELDGWVGYIFEETDA